MSGKLSINHMANHMLRFMRSWAPRRSRLIGFSCMYVVLQLKSAYLPFWEASLQT